MLGSGCESVEKGVLDILNCGAVAPKLGFTGEPGLGVNFNEGLGGSCWFVIQKLVFRAVFFDKI